MNLLFIDKLIVDGEIVEIRAASWLVAQCSEVQAICF